MQKPTDWAAGNSEDLRMVSDTDRRGKPLRTVINMQTGLVRNDPIPNDDALARFYAEDYRVSYKGATRPRRRQVFRNFRRVAKYIREFDDVLSPAKKVLDIGAGSGEFVFLMKQLGKEAAGIEPNAGYAAYCRDALGLNIKTAHLSPDIFAGVSFDFIMLSHVLEHLNDPVKYLDIIADRLTPEGVLYVEVPNIQTYAAQKSRGNMFHYGHIFNFNPWTLRAAAGMAGLIELPQTAARCKHDTRVFFRKGNRKYPPANPDNAEKVLRAIQLHYAGEFRKGKIAKPFRKIFARAEETIASLMNGAPDKIGIRIARELQNRRR